MENIISRIQDGIRNITFITTIQIILMIGLTTYSFASNSKIQGFSAMKSQTHFVEQLPYMFLHYYLSYLLTFYKSFFPLYYILY